MSQTPSRIALLGLGAVVLATAPASAHGRMGRGDPSDIAPPRGAHPGQCFAKVREPDGEERSTERLMVRPAGSYERAIPAVTRMIDKDVTVSPARTETIKHPAVFKTEWKTVTEPGRSYRVDTPARYRTVTRRVLIEPAHVVWKRGAGRPVTGQSYPGAVTYEATGEVLCRVLVPARYALTSERVLVSPGSHRTVQGPPIIHRTAERVQVSPARTEEVHHNAVVRTVRQTVVVTPARSETVRTPAEYRTIEHSRPVARYGWQPVVCDTPAPPPPPTPCCVRAEPHYAPRPAPQPPAQPPYGERG